MRQKDSTNGIMTRDKLLATWTVCILVCLRRNNVPQKIAHQHYYHMDYYNRIHQMTVVGAVHHNRRHQGHYQRRTHTPVVVYNYCHRPRHHQQMIHIPMDWIETLVGHTVPLTTLCF